MNEKAASPQPLPSPAWFRRRGSVRTQLIVWNTAALALLLLLLGVAARYTVQSFLLEAVDRELDQRVDRLFRRPPRRGGGPPPFGGGERGFPPPPSPEPWRDRRPFRPDMPPPPPRENDPYRPRRFDLAGASLEPADNVPPWDPSSVRAAVAQGQEIFSTISVGGVSLRVLSRPFPDRGPAEEVVQAAYPLAEVDRAIAGLNRALLVLLPIGLLCAVGAGAYLTDRVLRRVRRMTQVAGDIGARDFSKRLPVAGNDEFSELAETFNGLLGRLEHAFARQKRLLKLQRRFTADASHELRTPLTVIKGTTSLSLSGRPTEADYRESLAEIDQAADAMSHLVQDLLLLARSDEGHLGKNRIELLLREILDRAVANVGHREGPHIRVDMADDTLVVPGNEAELVRLFTNLLDNAKRYTPPDGDIHVTAARDGEEARVMVADTGPGISPEHLSHLGERFYRVDASRSRPDGGTGLGLSICQGIVEAHGGGLLFASTPGQGTIVTVVLPTAGGEAKERPAMVDR